jgi:IPT/TIG domain
MKQPRRARSVVALAVLAAVVAAGAGCGEDKKLKVSGLDPVQGDYQGGTTVRISGNRFQEDGVRNAKVYFGDRQGTVIKFDGDHDLYVTAPGGKKGDTVDVKIIFEPGGEKTLPKAFTFIEIKQADVDDLSTGSTK